MTFRLGYWNLFWSVGCPYHCSNHRFSDYQKVRIHHLIYPNCVQPHTHIGYGQ